MKSIGPMGGLRVLDMTRVIAGPYASQILGDLGAEVVKVERQGEGDDVRRVGPPWMKDGGGNDTEESTYFQAVNRNKRSLTVDFSTKEGAALIAELAAKADVFLENYRTGTLAKYGLDYESLRQINPRLVYVSLTGFGQTGPYADRSGYDYLVQAMAGMMSVTGHPDGMPGAGPLRVGVPVVDICAGLYSVIGVLAAINDRHETGLGQAIDISLFDSQISILLNAFSSWFNGGSELGRTGNDHPSAAPYGVYAVDDGHILIATFNDREFTRLAPAVGHPEWANDDRFSTNGARVANRALLADLLNGALQGKGKDEWVRIFNESKVSCGPINTVADLDNDPQVLARDIIVKMEHPQTGTVKTAASPLRFSRTQVTYRVAPPLTGEHSEDVLREWLGFGDAKLRQLKETKVI
ncbi:CoA transferase [Alcaligenaceae bacterium]|nr:CoA transferase [Alcaligenaceae bacterium]